MRNPDLNRLLRQSSARPGAELPEDFAARVLQRVESEGNPWHRDWRRFLAVWVPVGLALIAGLALAVALLPHGEHSRPAAPPVFPEEQP